MSDSRGISGFISLRRLSLASSLGTMVIAGVTLIGWIGSDRLLGSIRADYIPMAPSTGVCFMLLGATSLQLLRGPLIGSSRYVALSIAGLVALFGALEVVGHWTGLDLNFEDRLVPEAGSIHGIPLARMSPLTGALFFLRAMAPIMLLAGSFFEHKRKLLEDISGMAASLVLFGGATVLLAYLYGTPLMYEGRTIPMAATTATGFLLLGLAYLCTLDEGTLPRRYFGGSSTAARLTRVFVPLVACAVLIQGAIDQLAPQVWDVNEALLSALIAGIVAILAIPVTSRVTSAIGCAIDRTEQTLHAERQRLAVTLRSIGDGVISTDTAGRIASLNETAAVLTGWTEEEAVGKPIEEVFHIVRESARERCDSPVEKVLKTGTIVGLGNDTVLIARDGTERILADSAAPIRDESGSVLGVILTFRDVTEKRRAAEALRRSEQRYRALVENAPIGIMLIDDQGTILEVNSRLLDVFGSPSAEATKAINALSFPLLVEAGVSELFRTCMERGEPVTAELPYASKWEKEVYLRLLLTPIFDSETRMYHCQAVVEDVTDRKEAESALKKSEAALKESEERYRTLFERAKDAILIVHPEGEILDANTSALDMLRARREDVIGASALRFYWNPADRSRFCQTIDEQGYYKDYEWMFRTMDGSRRVGLVSSSAWRDADGGIVAYMSIARDVTDANLLEKQLREAQKMEAVGTLAGGIAHDFNNLLQVIAGYAELLTIDNDGRLEGSVELRAIRQAAERGADLVKRILTFSRRVESHFAPVNLNEEIRQTERLLYRTLPKMINIELRLEDGLDRISADTSQIEQLLLNLAINAKDAMPEGGTLIFETRNIRVEDHVSKSHLKLKPGEYVLLQVSDTGHGMEQNVLEHIFEPFFTTKKPGEGTGLGLSMVYGIVKIHGGHISCYSEPGRGTMFKIYFSAEKANVGERRTEARPVPAGGPETILVVDDEELIGDLVKKLLEGAGYTVIRVDNGQDAIDIYRKEKVNIDLVVLDMIMPGMSGRKCLEYLLEIDPQAKVLIASGFSVDNETRQFLSKAAKAVVTKPFNMRELLGSVRSVLDGM